MLLINLLYYFEGYVQLQRSETYKDNTYIHVQEKFRRITPTSMFKTSVRLRLGVVLRLLNSDTCTYKTTYRLTYSKWNAHVTNDVLPLSESGHMVSLSLNGEAADADPSLRLNTHLGSPLHPSQVPCHMSLDDRIPVVEKNRVYMWPSGFHVSGIMCPEKVHLSWKEL